MYSNILNVISKVQKDILYEIFDNNEINIWAESKGKREKLNYKDEGSISLLLNFSEEYIKKHLPFKLSKNSDKNILRKLPGLSERISELLSYSNNLLEPDIIAELIKLKENINEFESHLKYLAKKPIQETDEVTLLLAEMAKELIEKTNEAGMPQKNKKELLLIKELQKKYNKERQGIIEFIEIQTSAFLESIFLNLYDLYIEAKK